MYVCEYMYVCLYVCVHLLLYQTVSAQEKSSRSLLIDMRCRVLF